MKKLAVSVTLAAVVGLAAYAAEAAEAEGTQDRKEPAAASGTLAKIELAGAVAYTTGIDDDTEMLFGPHVGYK